MILPDRDLEMPVAELSQAAKMGLQVLPDSETLLLHMGRAIADEIANHNEAGQPTRLILPVGPVGQYVHLVRICNQESISWKNVFTFNMDEYCDWQGRAVPPEHPLSFRGFMQRNVFDALAENLRIPAGQVHFPDPLALDEISRRIEAVGGIDTCYGGLGYHGHVAFNEPPPSRWADVPVEEYRRSRTRVVPLAPDTLVMNSTWNTGGNPARMPPMAVTLGLGDILAARRIRLYCNGGPWQRTALRAALLAEPSVDYPVTLLQGHPDVLVISDEDTAQPALLS